jgi:hypothetical protein
MGKLPPEDMQIRPKFSMEIAGLEPISVPKKPEKITKLMISI